MQRINEATRINGKLIRKLVEINSNTLDKFGEDIDFNDKSVFQLKSDTPLIQNSKFGNIVYAIGLGDYFLANIPYHLNNDGIQSILLGNKLGYKIIPKNAVSVVKTDNNEALWEAVSGYLYSKYNDEMIKYTQTNNENTNKNMKIQAGKLKNILENHLKENKAPKTKPIVMKAGEMKNKLQEMVDKKKPKLQENVKMDKEGILNLVESVVSQIKESGENDYAGLKFVNNIGKKYQLSENIQKNIKSIIRENTLNGVATSKGAKKLFGFVNEACGCMKNEIYDELAEMVDYPMAEDLDSSIGLRDRLVDTSGREDEENYHQSFEDSPQYLEAKAKWEAENGEPYDDSWSPKDSLTPELKRKYGLEEIDEDFNEDDFEDDMYDFDQDEEGAYEFDKEQMRKKYDDEDRQILGDADFEPEYESQPDFDEPDSYGEFDDSDESWKQTDSHMMHSENISKLAEAKIANYKKHLTKR